jgi:hypothetical protein
MELRAASNTAISVARQRAAHQLLNDDPKVLADEIIVGLVPETTEGEIRANASILLQRPRRRARVNCLLRGRFTEDLLAAVPGWILLQIGNQIGLVV